MYMDNLLDICASDVRTLREKERTYKGSWKKRGGPGAFMVGARCWDRLEGIAEEQGYDIFLNPGDGSDGTLLAAIADMRRYLLLWEAEIQARSCEVATVSEAGEGMETPAAETPSPVPSEDSNRHADRMVAALPWLVNSIPSGMEGFYEKYSPTRWRLKEIVGWEIYYSIEPEERVVLSRTYTKIRSHDPENPNAWLLDRRWVRHQLEPLRPGLTQTQWEWLPWYYQELYTRDGGGRDTWSLKEEYAAWGP